MELLPIRPIQRRDLQRFLYKWLDCKTNDYQFIMIGADQSGTYRENFWVFPVRRWK